MERTDCHLGAEKWSTKMSGQHLASISDTATDTLATSPETFQAVGFKLLGKSALRLSLPVGTER